MHVHPYERGWIIFSVVLLTVFGLALVISTMSLGVRLPGIVDRAAVAAAATPEYDLGEGWVRELGPGRYEVNVIAKMWSFDPGEIHIPVGSEVTFLFQSEDIVHGFKIMNTTVSTMVIPGQTGRVTYTFTEPGEFPFVCHEYCGVGHHLMSGKVIVE